MVKRSTVRAPAVDHNRYYIDASAEYGFAAGSASMIALVESRPAILQTSSRLDVTHTNAELLACQGEVQRELRAVVDLNLANQERHLRSDFAQERPGWSAD